MKVKWQDSQKNKTNHKLILVTDGKFIHFYTNKPN